MRAFALRVLDIGADPADDADLRLRKRTAVAVLLVVCAANLAYTMLGFVADRPLILIFSTAQLVGQLINLAIFSRIRRLEPMVIVVLIIGMLVIFSGVLTLGGLATSAGNMVWGVLTPIGAVLLIGNRAGVPAYLGLAVAVLVSALLTPIIPHDQALPESATVALTVLNLLGPAAIALGLVRYIDGQRLAARRQSDALLLNVLPKTTAERLKSGERDIADHYEAASVLFADIVGFTPLAEANSPQEIVAVLNRLFTDFDRLAVRFGLEKIKTIGDAYMAVAGVPTPRADHAQAALEMALAMHARMVDGPPVAGRQLQIRCGIASGPLVAGVIGENKFIYDLWGDTVNLAARMESSGVPGCIQVTDATHALLDGRYAFRRREGVEVKGKGLMSTWLLEPAVEQP
ncbi:MAG TPA: adenylate/guanylate cyclase domain-containing protein [Candidatus Limnocylindrales bacterium]|nr:adenylate/guanylate cyclase domain-containing protein [Candidatus Limnocylindrales bacterium]